MVLKWFGRRRKAQRVLVLGLDCASPHLIFDQFRPHLPHLSQLMSQGLWGELQSSIPCITVPAWSSMLSSRDAGVLGIYGFRNRADYSYDALTSADSSAVKEPRVWDILSAAGKQSLVMNVPQTYPVQALNGHLASCFLTPDSAAQFAYPAIFKQELLKRFPDYAFDVHDFRKIERSELLERIIALTNRHYEAFDYALTHKSWDFAMQVNIGLDRMHHAFWRYHDPEHRLHEADSPFRTAIFNYYKLVDSWIGRILSHIGEDVAIIVVSDHGVKRMDGAIAINEWLWQKGWLALKTEPKGITAFSHELVDWSQTRAWSTGGYYGRIFLNVAGREPQGVIPAVDYESVRDELAAQLAQIPDVNGQPMPNRIMKPEAIYQRVNGIAPDLIAYFGDLHWRTVGSIGYGQPYTLENDTGADDANHAEAGMFILQSPHSAKGCIQGAQLMDIAPTILDLMGVAIPASMQGKVLKA